MQAEILTNTWDGPNIPMCCRFICVLVCGGQPLFFIAARLHQRAAARLHQAGLEGPGGKRHREGEEQSKNTALERSGCINTVWENQKHSPPPQDAADNITKPR